jgi:hypothetical protein
MRIKRLYGIHKCCSIDCSSLPISGLDLRSYTMAPQTHRQSEVVHAKNEKKHEANTSLEPDVDHKAWKPDRNVKMALAVQTFCVVRHMQLPARERQLTLFDSS